ncbi:MAG: hypothetical protein IPJ65_00300 [Archangiaceae bacterium]|nr:hypothetical protein [Archangiaceae bacterium]
MRLLCPTLLALALTACGAPKTGSLSAHISLDSTAGSTVTTDDGWAFSFTHVVVALNDFAVSGMGTAGFKEAFKPKLVDFIGKSSVDLGSNAEATPQKYDSISLTLSRGASDENVNLSSELLNDAGGNRPLYLEGTASKGSTQRDFKLGITTAITFQGCMPAVTLDALGSASVELKLHPQRLFLDDAGKMRFEVWALADASPLDGHVTNLEAAAVQTSSLPAAQYGGTTGSLVTVLEKRALTLVTLGDSGSCSTK